MASLALRTIARSPALSLSLGLTPLFPNAQETGIDDRTMSGRRDGTFFGDPGMRGNGPPNIEGMITLKVDNVPYNSSIEDLRRIFEKYGELGDVYMPRDLRTGEPRGFAFVRFMDQRDADDAIDRMDGEYFAGRELRIQYARKRRPEGSYGGGGGGGGGYGGGGGGYGGGGGRHDRRDDRRDDYRRSSRRSRSRSRGRSHSRSRDRDRSRSRDHRRRRSSRSPSPPPRRRSRSRSPPPRRSNRSRSRSSSPPRRSRHRDGSAENGSASSRKGRDRRDSSVDGGGGGRDGEGDRKADTQNGHRDSSTSSPRKNRGGSDAGSPSPR